MKQKCFWWNLKRRSVFEDDAGYQAGKLLRVVADDVSRGFKQVLQYHPASGIREAEAHKVGFLFLVEGQETVIGPLGVDDGAVDLTADKTFYAGNEIAGLKVVRFTEFGHDVDHMINGCGYGVDFFPQAGDDEVGNDAGEKVTGSHDDII